ncbi:5-oxoprolinase subunit PxpB [Marinoscillum sp.]|uniref:5-oxoprolinase subunit PxpB n=1 Tax=Marinoscillum sp. TaxID=2024838 RepID=UPI003BAD9C60
MRNIHIKSMDESNLLMEWPGAISKDIMKEIAAWQHAIEKNLGHLIIECFAAYRSLLITYDHQQIDAEDLEIELLKLPIDRKKFRTKKWAVPVCYEEEFAQDLLPYCDAKKLTKKSIIKLHTAPLYDIHFYGFLPGFMYLGGLDEKLAIPRKSNPDAKIPAGSVAIGGNQTGIYPTQSPGGWHVIGNSPIPLFDITLDPPCPFSPGDHIKFKAISKKEYLKTKEEVTNGTYKYQKA